MFNSTSSFYVQAGIRTIELGGRNDSLALNGADPENLAYRKAVYPGLTSFMRDVFSAYNEGSITETVKIQIFSEVKDITISDIISFRNKTQVNTVVDQSALVAELQAKLAASETGRLEAVENVNRLSTEVNQLQVKVSKLSALASNIRSVNLNGVVTKIADLTGVKLG